MAERVDDASFPLGPALDFLRHLWRLNHALERASRRMDRDLGLTAQQRFLLRCVASFPRITPGEVARALHLDPGTVTSTVRRLEKKGLITRRRDPADKRRVTLGLTAAGHALDRPASGSVEASVDALLSRAASAEIVATTATLARLVEQLERDGEG